jgi:hypothetical protein
VGEGIKIGWTTNLQRRMRTFYLPLSAVLAVIPGGLDVEAACQDMFAAYNIPDSRRRELFDIETHVKKLARLESPAAIPSGIAPASHRRDRRPIVPHKRPPFFLDEDALLDLLKRPEGVSASEAARILGAKKTPTWQRIKSLQKAGLAEMRGHTRVARFHATEASPDAPSGQMGA